MSSLRQDPLTGRWVIIAEGRSARPNEFPAHHRDYKPVRDCPFCPGHENQTTSEVLSLGRPAGQPVNSPGWRLRAFPNLYPALEPQMATSGAGPALFRQAAGVGRHEVVVYTPDHLGSPASLSVAEMADLLLVLRDRARVFSGHPQVRYVSVFCNHGPEAGATLAHPHMQIIGAPEIPLLAAAKAERCGKYYRAAGGCLVCELAAAERADGARLIANNDDWTAFAPWASRFPWEMIFVPRPHQASLNEATAEGLHALARVLVPALQALFRLHQDPSLNIVVHSATVTADGQTEAPTSSHWHLEVLPRLSRPAGFEVGTGYTINSVVPEEAARWLRQEQEKK